ncbi:MAG: DUF3427 domain-containing protein [Gemmatimonadota bacterium]
MGCPFCPPDPERVFYEGERVLALWDAFPVSDGHALLVLRRHVASWFDADPDEQLELVRATALVRAHIEMKHRPAGYTVGINVGEAAGQTVPHLHVHVIPRYPGDVPDPRGGVRHVIPWRGNYLAPPADALTPAPGHSGRPNRKALLTGGLDDPLLPHLIAHLDQATRVDIAVAFALESGVSELEEHLRDVLDRGGRVRVIAGDYLGVTEPPALHRLLDLQSAESKGQLELRIFESAGTSFHPKAYIVCQQDGSGAAFVGSSNLSRTALRRGVEWNYQVVPSVDEHGFGEVLRAFEQLWTHPQVRTVDPQWVQSYQARRRPAEPLVTGTPAELEPVPVPHEIQLRALEALERTRADGNSAGLVVLATGLGKTWLSAFDSERLGARRILFVAHREEILGQAMKTFRRIRPTATLGHYSGKAKAPDAEILFASIQTLSRWNHLQRFDPKEFDYIVVDEFHHAAARSYRKVIGYFEPRFLLGLTATPERTDGSDLLALCGDNLVYRADVADGIRRDLLCPFDYYGVPDQVDYDQIPWRSRRFDEEALTRAVATQARAENALEQLQKRGGERTVAFCVSQRHADFMAESLSQQGLRAVAVHAGSSSAPRAHSLERLEAGELDVICSVDMFNEGVDLPQVDTVLMLRPTESRILWLQQFGRGLRWREGKRLKVIDYIGNHRVFLTKAQALFDLGNADRDVAMMLEQQEAGTLELPPGCSVTYELEVRDILRSLLKTTTAGEQLEEYYRDFRELRGVRPLASEAFLDGYNPRSTKKGGYGSWLDFVQAMGDLSEPQRQVGERIGAFLDQLDSTPMTKSYKMLVLQAMLSEGALPGRIGIERLVERFAHHARRYTALRTELGAPLEDAAALRKLIEKNPIAAWVSGAGTGQTSYFSYEEGVFSTTFSVPEELEETAADLAAELVEWRLMEYLHRTGGVSGPDRFVCKVSHSGGTPILFLPDRKAQPGLPEGFVDVVADDRWYQAKFVKVAVNVMNEPGRSENVLADVLRGWFGPQAGQPGRTDRVVFEAVGQGYRMKPVRAEEVLAEGPVLWRKYTRAEAFQAVGVQPKGFETQVGVVPRPDQILLFVTLDKKGKPEEHRYEDRFLSPTEFQWQSQNKTSQASKLGQALRHHEERGVAVRLFVRKAAKVGGKTEPFRYAGELVFQRWEGEKPITVWWALKAGVPEGVWGEVG